MAEFSKALPIVLKHEGGYVNDKSDAGGETKYGISKRSFPDVDIKRLTVTDAARIYKDHYWSPLLERLDDQEVATKLFDLIVNMGAGRAVRLFQSSVNRVSAGVRPIPVDGKLGPMTVGRANAIDAARLLEALREAAAGHYRAIVKAKPNQQKFLRGWLNRAYD